MFRIDSNKRCSIINKIKFFGNGCFEKASSVNLESTFAGINFKIVHFFNHIFDIVVIKKFGNSLLTKFDSHNLAPLLIQPSKIRLQPMMTLRSKVVQSGRSRRILEVFWAKVGGFKVNGPLKI